VSPISIDPVRSGALLGTEQPPIGANNHLDEFAIHDLDGGADDLVRSAKSRIVGD
jgi:hypothetical protein